jgi:hypothetical protein
MSVSIRSLSADPSSLSASTNAIRTVLFLCIHFVDRILAHQGRAASQPCILSSSSDQQVALQRHHKLNTVVTMSHGFISGAPNDHRGRPDNDTGSGVYQHKRNSVMSRNTIKKLQPLCSSPHDSDDAIFKNQESTVQMFTFPNGRIKECDS